MERAIFLPLGALRVKQNSPRRLGSPVTVLTGLNDTVFNPSVLPDGTYTLIYSSGSGNCMSSDTLVFVDHPGLTTQITASNLTVCEDGGSTITVNVVDGPLGYPVFHQWSDGLFPVATQSVTPDSTHTYLVSTTDGCSDPVIDSITIVVHPPFQESFTFSAMQCYGEPGYITGTVTGQGTYTFTWATSPDQTGDSIVFSAGALVNVEPLPACRST